MGEILIQADVDKIEAEIRQRELEIRPQILQEVKEARAQGDLSENFEYHAAKQARGKNEGRIKYLKNVLKYATVISDESKPDEVGMNDTVTVYNLDEEEDETYRIVTSIRANALKHLVSIGSPIGSALLGHKVGDTVTVHVHSKDNMGGEHVYDYDVEITKIEKTGNLPTDEIGTY